MKRPAKSFKAIVAASLFAILMIGTTGQASSAPKPQFVYTTASAAGTVLGYAIDSTTGALSAVPGSPFAAGLSPLALALTPSNKFLYVTNYGSGTISAYTVDGTTGALTPVSGSPFATRVAARSVAIDPSGKFVYVGCDSSGTDLWAYAIDQTTGALTPVPGSPYYTAPISYQTGWNAWALAVDPSGKFLYVSTEQPSVLTYQIDSNTGALTGVSSSYYGPGVQPSSLGVDPSGKFVYVTGMRDVFAYTTDNTTGALTPVTGSPFESGFPYMQSLAIDPLGRFVYTTNSNPNGLSAYTINRTTGALAPISGSPFAWATGFYMAIDPSGKFAYVANAGSSNAIGAYTIDGTTGTLAPISGSPFAVGTTPGPLAITNAPSSTSAPFETFKAKVYINEDRKTSFRIDGFFTLSEGNSGVDPVTQNVALQVGSYTVTIPAGSFKQRGKHDSDSDDHKDRKKLQFEFAGEINGVDVRIGIYQAKGNEYLFTAEGRGHILQGITNPVTVGLTIGEYEGSASVKADIDK